MMTAAKQHEEGGRQVNSMKEAFSIKSPPHRLRKAASQLGQQFALVRGWETERAFFAVPIKTITPNRERLRPRTLPGPELSGTSLRKPVRHLEARSRKPVC
jgi:hypothetical protein